MEKALTDAALAAGHDVTHLNRGKTSPPDARVKTIIGDRSDEAALARTIADTLAWDRTRPAGREWKAGLAPSREADLPAAWTRRRRRAAG